MCTVKFAEPKAGVNIILINFEHFVDMACYVRVTGVDFYTAYAFWVRFLRADCNDIIHGNERFKTFLGVLGARWGRCRMFDANRR